MTIRELKRNLYKKNNIILKGCYKDLKYKPSNVPLLKIIVKKRDIKKDIIEIFINGTIIKNNQLYNIKNIYNISNKNSYDYTNLKNIIYNFYKYL